MPLFRLNASSYRVKIIEFLVPPFAVNGAARHTLPHCPLPAAASTSRFRQARRFEEGRLGYLPPDELSPTPEGGPFGGGQAGQLLSRCLGHSMSQAAFLQRQPRFELYRVSQSALAQTSKGSERVK